ncbi:Zn-ribbon domain-containing OB-fold protein [Halorubrum sp. DTA98]|uniref:Zn-ribbon domain-containing OB-fold protein n=1 Tax=Halorubrum sp. DTA98 TaxID=3402163 RepID=UPI003AAB6D92
MTESSDRSNGAAEADAVRNAGYDDWLDALAEGDGYYLESPEGHGSLPPRRVCPHSGSTDLSEESLPDVGAVESFTVVHVPPPRFADDAPYVTAIADFGPVRITGVLRGVEPDDDAIPLGLAVEVDVEHRETDGERVVVLRPE